jgi:hypothetical protein
MREFKRVLMMTTAAAMCAVPLLAFGQTATPSQAPSNTPGAPGMTQPNTRDGTPGNPPSTATPRAIDGVTGQRTDPDGTGNNPPGTAAGRAIDRATDGATSGTTTATPPRATTGTNMAQPPAATTNMDRSGSVAAPAGSLAADSARVTGGRRASKVIGSTVYNEANESIGEVDDIIIPAGTTQPVAILSVGGFLGIGARLVAVPYERLQHGGDRDRWMLQGATKDSLRTLPEFRYEGDTVQPRG